jgi:hypothetical protein
MEVDRIPLCQLAVALNSGWLFIEFDRLGRDTFAVVARRQYRVRLVLS